MSIAKVQHYVPQFLLRNFGNGKKDQIWVYDKTSDRSFPTNAKNVASESRFYDFVHEGEQISLEPWLSELEGQAKSVIKSIIEADSVANLGDEQKLLLSSFLAVQLTRTKTFREQWNAFPRMLREHFQSRGERVDPESQAEQLLRDLSENDSKEQTARIVLHAPATYASYFLDKQWILAATTRRHPFLVSDNPLTRQNMLVRPHRSNLGLRSEGIEIYFPLSPTRALALWCPTLVELVHRSAGVPVTMLSNNQATEISGPDEIETLSDALLRGGLVHYSPPNVDNFNALQVSWSERYIFSSVNDFDLARQMVAEHPKLKDGPRTEIA